MGDGEGRGAVTSIEATPPLEVYMYLDLKEVNKYVLIFLATEISTVDSRYLDFGYLE